MMTCILFSPLWFRDAPLLFCAKSVYLQLGCQEDPQ